MIILGVDPGTWNMGVGLIEAEGNRYQLIHFEVISNKKGIELPQRLKKIYQRLSEVVEKYSPEVLAIENVFFAKDIRATVKIGEARSCAMLAAAQKNIQVLEYPPARVKQAVCGNGRASKVQMQQMVQKLLGMKEMPPSDGADALAVAICHWHSRNRKKILEMI